MSETSDQTIRRILDGYEIGKKLKRLRLKKKIGLVDLGKHTGLSASMLSQLENGKLVPTLPTLARIAMVFDVPLDHFFDVGGRNSVFSVVRAAERIRFPDEADASNPSFFFECLAFSAQNKSLEAYLAEFPKRDREQVREHRHDGAEFLYVCSGSLALHIAGQELSLNSGDSVYFDGSEPHSYQGLAKGKATALVVTTPPRL